MRSRMFLVGIAVSWLFAAQGMAATAQQDKMKTCNAEASQKALKGADRQAFMKTCLSAKAPAGNSQQEKMKACNSQAGEKGLKGDARKTFMSSCLSGK